MGKVFGNMVLGPVRVGGPTTTNMDGGLYWLWGCMDLTRPHDAGCS